VALSPCRSSESASSASASTIAGYALAQFAIAYSLIAQMGLYIHEGHGQIVRNIAEMIGRIW
jgi:pyridoxine 5'-phosphate synthase PdxJ